MTESVRAACRALGRQALLWASFLGFALPSAAVHAQAHECGPLCELYGDLLEAPERDLIGSIRTLERVARPALGAGNTRGRWIQRSAYLGNEGFDTTFYIRNGLIRRIELSSTASDSACRSLAPWAATIDTLETWQGKGNVSGQFNSGNGTQQSVHWASGNLDVTVYVSIQTDACSTSVTMKKIEPKDAAEL